MIRIKQEKWQEFCDRAEEFGLENSFGSYTGEEKGNTRRNG